MPNCEKNEMGRYMASDHFKDLEASYVRLTYDDLSDAGAVNLAEAILDTIYYDYEKIIESAKIEPKETRNLINYYLLTSYINSHAFNVLTLGNGQFVRDKLVSEYGRLDDSCYEIGRKAYRKREMDAASKARRRERDRLNKNKPKKRGRKKKSETNNI